MVIPVPGFAPVLCGRQFAAERLVDMAMKLGSTDNVSVIVVLLSTLMRL